MCRINFMLYSETRTRNCASVMMKGFSHRTDSRREVHQHANANALPDGRSGFTSSFSAPGPSSSLFLAGVTCVGVPVS